MEHESSRTNFVIRVLLGLVFIYIGFSRLFRGFVPPLNMAPFLNQQTFVPLFGIVEIALGLLLLIGLLTRVSAFAGGLLIIFFIAISMIYGAFDRYLMIKDIAMLAICIDLVIYGAVSYSIDNVIKNI